MSSSRPRLKLWLGLILLLAGSHAHGEDDLLKRRKQAQANLCAPARPTDDAKTEADFCIECAIGVVSTTPEKIPTDQLTPLELHELNYLSGLNNDGTSITELTVQLEDATEDVKHAHQTASAAQSELESVTNLLNQITAAELAESGISPSSLPQLSELLKRDQSSLRSKLKHYQIQLEAFKKIKKEDIVPLESELIEASQKKMSETQTQLGQLQTIASQLQELPPKANVRGPVLLDLKALVTRARDEAKLNYESARDDEEELQREKNRLERTIAEIDQAAKISATSSPMEQRAQLQKLRDKFSKVGAAKVKDPGYTDCGLTRGETLALTAYTQSAFKAINQAMRTEEDLNKYQPAIMLIQSGLQKFSKYQGIVRRGVEFPKAVLDQHQPGQVVRYKSFSSTSLGRGFAYKPHQLVIHSKKGRYIAPYSNLNMEDEVLFAPSQFKVLSREDQADGSVKIVMEEVE